MNHLILAATTRNVIKKFPTQSALIEHRGTRYVYNDRQMFAMWNGETEIQAYK